MRPEIDTPQISTAATTDYEHLYGKGYYAHAAGSTSFDTAQLPEIVAGRAAEFNHAVLDIGGGNGVLGQALGARGIRTLTVDAADRAASDYIRCDLATHGPVVANDLHQRVVENIGETYLSTCFDVAEHIDIEHLADFVLNLGALVDSQLLLSVSTRPSSAANRFHSSVLPVTTWKRLFALAGFECQPCEELQILRPTRRFSGGEANIIAVSHWQRRNPFQEDHAAHQHYMQLTRTDAAPLDPTHLREAVADLTDIAYRKRKREMIGGSELPIVNYHVNFIQDWSFVRSLMDVWPAGRLRVTLRRDIIAEPYLHMLVGFLERTGCLHAVTSSVTEGIAAMESWGDLENSLVVTATEGLTTMTHLMGSLLLIEARKRGARTLSLQHGMSTPRTFTPAAAVLGAWDEGSVQTLQSLELDDSHVRVDCVGSPKFLDALLAPSSAALRNRLGDFTAAYEKTILIALNMHWNVHLHGTDDTYDWIVRTAHENSGTLFLLRPHPDDASSYEGRADKLPSNVMIVDEMLLLSIDWPVARLVRAVDGVLTTYSTLVIDAAAAGKPVALLPHKSSGAAHCDVFLPASNPWTEGASEIPVLSDEEWAKGHLPEALSGSSLVSHDGITRYFQPSLSSLERIAQVGRSPFPGGVASAEQSVNRALATAARGLSFDKHPHWNRGLITQAIYEFVSS